MGFWFSRILGRLFNLAGVPGLVQEATYRSSEFGPVVQVRKTALYTVVTVNGTDVYFHRLTGQIDGVGMTQRATPPPPEGTHAGGDDGR